MSEPNFSSLLKEADAFFGLDEGSGNSSQASTVVSNNVFDQADQFFFGRKDDLAQKALHAAYGHIDANGARAGLDAYDRQVFDRHHTAALRGVLAADVHDTNALAKEFAQEHDPDVRATKLEAWRTGLKARGKQGVTDAWYNLDNGEMVPFLGSVDAIANTRTAIAAAEKLNGPDAERLTPEEAAKLREDVYRVAVPMLRDEAQGVGIGGAAVKGAATMLPLMGELALQPELLLGDVPARMAGQNAFKYFAKMILPTLLKGTQTAVRQFPRTLASGYANQAPYVSPQGQVISNPTGNAAAFGKAFVNEATGYAAMGGAGVLNQMLPPAARALAQAPWAQNTGFTGTIQNTVAMKAADVAEASIPFGYNTKGDPDAAWADRMAQVLGGFDENAGQLAGMGAVDALMRFMHAPSRRNAAAAGLKSASASQAEREQQAAAMRAAHEEWQTAQTQQAQPVAQGQRLSDFTPIPPEPVAGRTEVADTPTLTKAPDPATGTSSAATPRPAPVTVEATPAQSPRAAQSTPRVPEEKAAVSGGVRPADIPLPEGAIPGYETTVTAGGKIYRAQYALVPDDQVDASHWFPPEGGIVANPNSNPAYQDRDPRTRLATIADHVDKGNPSFYLNNGQAAQDGPPVGVADERPGRLQILNGHGRTAELDQARQRKPGTRGAKDTWYEPELVRQSPIYGVDPEARAAGQSYSLYRILDPKSVPDADSRYFFAKIGNQVNTAAQSPLRMAASLRAMMSAGANRSILAALNMRGDPNLSLSDIISGNAGKSWRDEMHANLLKLAPSQKDLYFMADGKLTDVGKSIATNMIMSEAVPDVSLLERIRVQSAALTKTLDQALPKLLAMGNSNPALLEKFNKGLRFYMEEMNGLDANPDKRIPYESASRQEGFAFHEGAPEDVFARFIEKYGGESLEFKRRLGAILGEVERQKTKALPGMELSEEQLNQYIRTVLEDQTASGVKQAGLDLSGKSVEKAAEAPTPAAEPVKPVESPRPAEETPAPTPREAVATTPVKKPKGMKRQPKAAPEPAPVETPAQPAPAPEVKGKAAAALAPEALQERIRQRRLQRGESAYVAPEERAGPPRADEMGETSKPGTGEEVTRQGLIAAAREDFGVPVKQGKILSPRAAGIYKRFIDVIRMRYKNSADVPVFAHELAHHLDYTGEMIKSAPKDVKVELAPLDYDVERQDKHEGFAEYIRRKLTTDEDMRAATPKADAWFEAWRKQHPELSSKLTTFEQNVTDWRKMSTLAQAKAQVSLDGKYPDPTGQTFMQKLGKGASGKWHEWYTKWVNSLHPITQMENFFEAAKTGYKRHVEDILIANEAGRAYSRVEWMVEHGLQHLDDSTPVYAKDEKTPLSLKKYVLEDIHQSDLDGLAHYIVGRRALELAAKGKTTGLSIEQARALMDEAKANGKAGLYERAAERLTEFNNGLLDVCVKAGLLDEATANRFKEDHPDYAPFLRVLPDQGIFAAGGHGSKMTAGTGLMRFKGSEAPILNPVLGTILRMQTLVGNAMRQRGIEALTGLADKQPGSARFIEKIPPDMKRMAVSASELKEALRREGLDDEFLDMLPKGAEYAFYRPEYNPSTRKMRVVVNKKGELGNTLEMYELSPELMAWATTQNPVRGFAFKALATLANLKKLGATGLSPAFAARNLVRDYFTYLAQAKHGNQSDYFRNLKNFTAYTVADMLGKSPGDPIIEHYLSHGGERAIEFSRDARGAQNILRGLVTPDPLGQRLLHAMISPVESFRAGVRGTQRAIGLGELPARLAEFEGALRSRGVTRETLAAGTPIPEADMAYALKRAAEVSHNFGRSGTEGKTVNQIMPFFNARLQGIDQSIRSAKADPRTLIFVGGTVGAAAAYWYWMKNNEKYAQAPRWLKDNYIVLPGGYWLPKPRELGGLVWNATEAALDAMYKGEWEGAKSLPWEQAKTVSPFGMIAGQEFIEASDITAGPQGWDTFRGRPILSETEVKQNVEDRSNIYTTDASRTLSKWTGSQVAPAKIEHVLSGVTGGLYGRAGTLSDYLLGQRQSIPGGMFNAAAAHKDYTKAPEEYRQALESARNQYNSDKRDFRDRAPAHAEKRRLETYEPFMQALRAAQPKGTETQDVQNEYKRWETGAALAAMREKTGDTFPNPFNAPPESMPAPVRSAVTLTLQRVAAQLAHPAPMGKGDLDKWKQEQAETLQFVKDNGITYEQFKQALTAKWQNDRANMRNFNVNLTLSRVARALATLTQKN